MDKLFMWVGLLFVVIVSLVVSTICIGFIRTVWHDRKYNSLEGSWKTSMVDVLRWCDYEYPQIGFMATEITKNLFAGTTIQASVFREELRKKFPAIEE